MHLEALSTTAPAGVRPGPEDGLPDPGRAPATRRVVAAAGLVLVLVGLLTSMPFAVLLGCVLAGASLLVPWLALDTALVAGSLGWLLTATAVGMGAAALGVDLLSSSWAVSAALLLVAVVAVALAAADLPRRRPARRSSRGVALAYVPSLLAVAGAVVQGATSRTAASWAFIATDFVQHMSAVKEIQTSGSLDYAADAYPRGVHMLLALTAAPAAAGRGPASLLTLDMHVVAAGVWLCLALVLLTAAAVALRLGRLLGLPETVVVLAATLGAASILVFNPFVYAFAYMAAAPSLTALVVMWAFPLAALDLGPSARRTVWLPVVAGASVALLANLYQVLAVVPVVALASTVPLWRVVRGTVPRCDVRDAVRASAVVAVPVVALSLPPVLDIFKAVGTAQAGVSGLLETAPVAVTVLAVLSVVRLVPHRAATGARAYAGTAAGLVVVIAFLVRESGRFDLEQYYPSKGIWFLTVLLMPLLALVAVELAWRSARATARALDRLGPAARTARVAGVALVVAAGVGFVLPVPAVTGLAAFDMQRYGDAADLSGLRYDMALQYGTEFRPDRTVPIEVGVGPTLDPESTLMVSRLISFETGQPVNRGLPRFVCADVRRVAGSGPAVVLTSVDPAALEAVMRQGGCGDVRVVRRFGPARQLEVPLVPVGSPVLQG